MSKAIAWEILHEIVSPRMKEVGLSKEMKFPYGTVMSTMDWENGLAVWTPKGEIHILGTGEIVDEKNLLKFQPEGERSI